VRQAQLGQRVQPRVLGEVLNGQSRLIELGFRQGGTAGYGWSFCALQEWRRHIYQLEDVAYQMRGLAGRVALNGGTAPGRLGED
jgi:hypothetical protein